MARTGVKRSAWIVTAGALAVTAGSAHLSGSASTTLPVSAVVIHNCTVSASPVQFGAYDPVTANARTSLTVSGTVTIACTRGSSPVIGLSAGSHAAGGTRRASDGTNYLAYELFKDTGLTEPWGDKGSDALQAGVALSRTPRRFQVHARIPAGQDVPAGTYTDTIVVSVNF